MKPSRVHECSQKLGGGGHGPEGEGAPPEINSIIDPVRATSASLILERMKKRGAEMSRKDATGLAQQSQSSLLDRLHKGGKNMPNPGLSEIEIQVLMPYLHQLAGLPAKQISTHESAVRVGEHLVKSTCHICHAAVGTNPSPEQIGAGVIPPLSTLTSRTSLEQSVRKVTQGASVTSGQLALPSRGRMPAFSYISDTEAAAAYFYLLAYPPQFEEENPKSHASPSASKQRLSHVSDHRKVMLPTRAIRPLNFECPDCRSTWQEELIFSPPVMEEANAEAQ